MNLQYPLEDEWATQPIGTLWREKLSCQQEVNLNVTISNEPAKCNLRASQPKKKPSDKRRIFYGTKTAQL